MENAFIKEKLRNLKLQFNHPSYALERQLLRSITLGMLEESLRVLHVINSFERPQLSRNSLRSLKNSLIGSCTLFTRAVIQAGVSAEDAFDLSDAMIYEIESFEKESGLQEFEYEMVKNFIGLIKSSDIASYRYPVSMLVNYIHEHVTAKLSVSDMAHMTNLSTDYLSKLFHEEVGIAISDYIMLQKVEAAKNFLVYDDMKIMDIATLLAFCNHGHFSAMFKKHTGFTPMEYRVKKKYSQ